MNSKGHVVGISNGFSTYRAVRWFGGEAVLLEISVGDQSDALDINDLDQVCGWMGSDPYPIFGATPFIWNNGKTTALPLPPHAVNNSGAATAINNRGDACGYFYTYDRPTKNYVRQACAWIDGRLIELGTLPGYAGAFPADINDAREIVGYLTEETGVAIAPFIWRDGVMFDLNDLVSMEIGFINIPWAINNKGQIAGEAIIQSPNLHSAAFLLTPALPATPGDTNCTGTVNTDDLINVVGGWNPQGPVGGGALADLNRDNRIDALDLLEVIQHWTAPPLPAPPR